MEHAEFSQHNHFQALWMRTHEIEIFPIDQTHFTLPPLHFGAASMAPSDRAPSITPCAHAQRLTDPARIHARLYPVPE